MTSHFKYLVMDGEIVPFDEARVHIITPAVRYGATAFEGIKAHWNETKQQIFVFRGPEHLARLLQSARLMGMEGVEYSVDDLLRVVLELLRANEIRQDVHIRPSLFVLGDGSLQARGPVSLGVVVVSAGAVVDASRWREKPFRLAVSSWRRIEDNAMSPRIKCAANYQNGRLALVQAEEDGYDGVLMLDVQGHVTEEARACFFIVRGIAGRALADMKSALLQRILAQVDRRPVSATIVLRLIFWMAPQLNYGLALTRIRYRDYLVGSAIGLAPPVLGIVVFFEWLFEQDVATLIRTCWPYALVAVIVVLAALVVWRLRVRKQTRSASREEA